MSAAAAPGRGMASPCIGTCTLHPKAQICTGCLRTLDEIAGWSSLTDAERSRIMAALPARRHRLEPDAAP